MQISQSNNELCRYNLQVQRSQLTERERERERGEIFTFSKDSFHGNV